VIIGSPHVECVCPFEAEHNPILIVYPYGVQPSLFTDARSHQQALQSGKVTTEP